MEQGSEVVILGEHDGTTFMGPIITYSDVAKSHGSRPPSLEQ